MKWKTAAMKFLNLDFLQQAVGGYWEIVEVTLGSEATP
jgi:hypothetical protein